MKAECPACKSWTSYVYDALHGEREACDNCGLPGSVMREVEAARKAKADEALTAKLEEALLRAGKAEGELRDLRTKMGEFRRLARRIADGCPDEDDD